MNKLTTALFILVYLVAFSALGYTVISRQGIRIDQDIEACNDESHFQIYTYVFDGGSIVYSSRTWKYSENNCLTISQVDSSQKAEKTKAEQFINVYKTINK